MSAKIKYALPAYNQDTGIFQVTYLNENNQQVMEPFDEGKHLGLFGKIKVQELKRIFMNIADRNVLPDNVGEELSKINLYEIQRAFIKKILYFEDKQLYHYFAQYSFNTYVFDLHDHVNVTMLVAPSNRGKTVNQEALYRIVHLPCFGSGADSSAYLRRAVDLGFTPIIDESQSALSDTKSDDHALLTAGTSKGGRINRVQPVKNGEDFIIQSFKAFGPKIYGARYIPDDEAILNRSFVVRLMKVDEKKFSTLLDPLSDLAIKTGQYIRNNMTYYRLKRLNGLKDVPSMKELEADGYILSGRTKKLFGPLLLESPTDIGRESLYRLIQDQQTAMKVDRENSIESTIVLSGFKLLCHQDANPTCKNISIMSQDWLGIRVSAKTVGKILRQYGISTRRTQCGFEIDCTIEEYKTKLQELDLNIPEITNNNNLTGVL